MTNHSKSCERHSSSIKKCIKAIKFNYSNITHFKTNPNDAKDFLDYGTPKYYFKPIFIIPLNNLKILLDKYGEDNLIRMFESDADLNSKVQEKVNRILNKCNSKTNL